MAVLILGEGQLLLRLCLCEEQILEGQLPDLEKLDEVLVPDASEVLLIESSIGDVLEEVLQLCDVGGLDYVVEVCLRQHVPVKRLCLLFERETHLLIQIQIYYKLYAKSAAGWRV